MVNTFKLAQDTLVIDGLTYEQMVDLNSFVYHGAFERFYHTEYVKKPDGGIFGTTAFQIVAKGSVKDLFMLEILANRVEEIETARHRAKLEKVPTASECVPRRKVKMNELPTSAEGLPWDY